MTRFYCFALGPKNLMTQIICQLQCLPLPLPAQVMKMGQRFVQEILRKVVITLTS